MQFVCFPSLPAVMVQMGEVEGTREKAESQDRCRGEREWGCLVLRKLRSEAVNVGNLFNICIYVFIHMPPFPAAIQGSKIAYKTSKQENTTEQNTL